ncbi:MAG: hypothetical protein ISS70_17235 [Phycisphaerae bacterium]|nr:hypothetical protein [Phycisphaerae bacterium]
MIHLPKVLSGAIVCLLQLAFAGQIVRAEVIPYPRAAGERANLDFLSVKIDGIPVDTVSTDMNVGYAHFAFSGAVAVEVTTTEMIETFDLSPHRYGIQATAKGNVLSFRLFQPRKLHLKINGLRRFFIFADPPEVNPPRPGQAGVYDIRDYGVTSSLESVQTSKIQRAIDDVAAKKGVLYVQPGLYQSGELKMKSNLTLYLAAGAVVKGTAKVSDYPRGGFGTQLIHLLDCENVRIAGRGVIDGRGRALRLATENSSEGRLKLIRSFRAKNCVVEDVLLLDAGSWSIHLIESSDLRFTNTKLISNTILDDPAFAWEPNTDGFDPDNSSRVIIENGFVSCSDDAIAVKLRYGTLRDMDDVRFQNNVVWTVKSALKIGTEVVDRKMTNIVFENNEVIHADRGIVVYCYRGATIENPKWINNYFERIGDNTKEMNMEIKIQDDGGTGHLNNVFIKDNTFERFSRNPSRLGGLDGEHVLDGIVFDNLVIAGKKRTSLADAEITTNSFVRNVSFSLSANSPLLWAE